MTPRELILELSPPESVPVFQEQEEPVVPLSAMETNLFTGAFSTVLIDVKLNPSPERVLGVEYLGQEVIGALGESQAAEPLIPSAATEQLFVWLLEEGYTHHYQVQPIVAEVLMALAEKVDPTADQQHALLWSYTHEAWKMVYGLEVLTFLRSQQALEKELQDPTARQRLIESHRAIHESLPTLNEAITEVAMQFKGRVYSSHSLTQSLEKHFNIITKIITVVPWGRFQYHGGEPEVEALLKEVPPNLSNYQRILNHLLTQLETSPDLAPLPDGSEFPKEIETETKPPPTVFWNKIAKRLSPYIIYR